MTAGRVLLWRHGRTAHNAGARLQGQSDIPLDDVGRWQAGAAARALAGRFRPTRIVASDLGRAQETAQALAGLVGLPVHVDARVRERSFGEWEGLTAEEIAERWPQEHQRWRAGHEPERVGAETRAQVQERMLAGVLAEAGALAAEDTLVVVSHGAAISLAITGMLGIDPGWRGITGMSNAHWAEMAPSRPAAGVDWRLDALNVGPLGAAEDWDAGPDAELDEDEQDVRDPA